MYQEVKFLPKEWSTNKYHFIVKNKYIYFKCTLNPNDIYTKYDSVQNYLNIINSKIEESESIKAVYIKLKEIEFNNWIKKL